jgi:hypothetical protein
MAGNDFEIKKKFAGKIGVCSRLRKYGLVMSLVVEGFSGDLGWNSGCYDFSREL